MTIPPLRSAVLLLLATDPLAGQEQRGGAPTGSWSPQVFTEVSASRIAVGRIRLVNPLALLAAAKKLQGDYVEVQLDEPRILKDPAAEKGDAAKKGSKKPQPLRFRVFVPPRANNPHGYDPTIEGLQDLLGERRIVFSQEVDGVHYLADRFHGTALLPVDPQAVRRVEKLIAKHANLARKPIVIADRELGRRVADLVRQVRADVASQRRALRDLEDLGWDAIPAIVASMDDRHPLPEAAITLRNLGEDAFEPERRYAPVQVIDALSAVLNQLTGLSFGIDWNKPTDRQRARELTAWRVYAQYRLLGAVQRPAWSTGRRRDR